MEERVDGNVFLLLKVLGKEAAPFLGQRQCPVAASASGGCSSGVLCAYQAAYLSVAILTGQGSISERKKKVCQKLVCAKLSNES
jgi:hypothetical protein